MSGSYYQKYEEIESIGSGNFGSVQLIREKKTNENWVSKKISLSKLKEDQQISALQEANLLKSLDNPHIVKYKDSYIEKGNLIIIMENCEEGDLQKHIKICKKKKQKFPEELILNWFLQILFGLKYVHELKILHRDLKSSNMFLSSNGLVKIGDFGISKILDKTQENAETVVGTPYYLSPEICQNIPYDYKSDVWSLGCILYELCTLKHPFLSQNLLGLVNKIVHERPKSIPKVYSRELQQLIFCLLEKDMDKRLSIDQILELDFVKKALGTFLEGECESDHQDFEPEMTPKERMRMKKILKAKKRENEINSFLKNSKILDLKQKKMEQMKSFLDRNNNKKKKLSVSEIDRKNNCERRKSYNPSFYLEEDLKKMKEFDPKEEFDDKTIRSFEFIEKEVYKKSFNNKNNREYQYTNYDFTNNSMYKKFEDKDQKNNSFKNQSKLERNRERSKFKEENDNDNFFENNSKKNHSKEMFNSNYKEDKNNNFQNSNSKIRNKKKCNFKKKKIQISEDEFPSDFENNLEEYISENEEISNHKNDGMIFNSKLKRIEKFKEKLNLKIGPNLFDKMYDFLLKEHKKNTPQKIVKNKVKVKFGKENLSHFFDIDQLLFMEKY